MRQKLAESRDFDWALGLNRLILNSMGVWSDEKFRTITRTKQAIIPCMIASIFMFYFLPVNFALTKIFGQQAAVVVDNCMYNIGSICAMSKLYLLWSSRKLFQPIIEMTQVDWRNNVKTAWKQEIMTKQARRARLFTLSGCIIEFLNVSSFLFVPVFGLSTRVINNITDPHEGLSLPFPSYYPFNYGTRPVFEFVYSTQVLAGIFCMFSVSTPDNFFGALVFHACGQCEILQIKTKTLLESDNLTPLNSDNFRSKLRKIVKSHVRLIRFVNAIEESFNLLILAQTLSITTLSCCLSFCAVKSFSNESESLPVIQIFTLSGTVINFNLHMFIYCMASEILSEKSLEFSNQLYCSYWYLLPPKYRADIIPVMIRSKQPLELTAGSFQNLSLNFFMKILKTSAGYFSVLLAVSK